MIGGIVTKVLVTKWTGNTILNFVMDFLDKSSRHKISYNFQGT